MAIEALALHVEGMMEDGEALPEPSSLDVIMAERANRDAVAFLVDLPARSQRAVRVNITVPEDVLARIDSEAEAVGVTRSRFLVDAALRRIGQAA